MGSIFLSGGGNKEQTEKIDQEFVQKLGKYDQMLYIPIAMDPNDVPYNACYEWINGTFNPLGISNITMWTDIKNKTLRELQGFSAIYISGGNTFHLLNEIRDRIFYAALIDYIATGGIVYGGSAGAIILGADIRTCAHADPNVVGLQHFDGLNLIGGYSVWCHYEAANDQLIERYIKNFQHPIIALTEETGIYVSDQGMKVLGTGPVFVFEREIIREITSGEAFY